jgi:hypothetical protein
MPGISPARHNGIDRTPVIPHERKLSSRNDASRDVPKWGYTRSTNLGSITGKPLELRLGRRVC